LPKSQHILRNGAKEFMADRDPVLPVPGGKNLPRYFLELLKVVESSTLNYDLCRDCSLLARHQHGGVNAAEERAPDG
jgi:hypothetical protein